MAKLLDISEWSEQSWWNTGGTRDKKIYLNPEDGDLYFFKQSYKKGKRDYKYEFWSEVIASEIGEVLGFDILNYSIAVKGDSIGCISKSMINQTSEELVEGGKFLQAFDNTFNPENSKLRHQYNFELIINTLIAFKKEEHIKPLVETIVFDALIGNSDRHQENWAIINNHGNSSDRSLFKENKKADQNLINKLAKTFGYFKDKFRPAVQDSRLMLSNQTRFAPIYDSGCSFGRELTEEKVESLLGNENEFEKYISKGKAEIHWGNKKISHFELLNQLNSKEGINSYLKDCLERVVHLFDESKIRDIVLLVDSELIKNESQHFLPEERKLLILKILNLRFNRLKEIHSQIK